MRWLADALTLARLGLALFVPAALARPGWLGLIIVGAAAITDYVDGPIARRAGRPSRWGGVLDNVADIAVVLGGSIAAARLDRVPWAVPWAIVLSVSAYVIASWRMSRGTGTPRLAASRVGHAAGVANWFVVGGVALGQAWPALMPPAVVWAFGYAVAALNVMAVALRFVPRSPGSPGAGRAGRSARS